MFIGPGRFETLQIWRNTGKEAFQIVVETVNQAIFINQGEGEVVKKVSLFQNSPVISIDVVQRAAAQIVE